MKGELVPFYKTGKKGRTGDLSQWGGKGKTEEMTTGRGENSALLARKCHVGFHSQETKSFKSGKH